MGNTIGLIQISLLTVLNVLFLLQDPIEDPMLYLVVMSPLSLPICDQHALAVHDLDP